MFTGKTAQEGQLKMAGEKVLTGPRKKKDAYIKKSPVTEDTE